MKAKYNYAMLSLFCHSNFESFCHMANLTKTTAQKKSLTPAMEDYLEAIFDLDKEKRVVRVKEIARRMNVKMPSVSSILNTLNYRGLVIYDKA